MCKARRLLTGFLALLLVLGAGALTLSRLKLGHVAWNHAPKAAAKAGETLTYSTAEGRVSANEADAEELCTVKGIGPKLAAAIKEHGTVANFVRQDQGDLVDWVRRRFRELYRLHKPEMQPGFDVILVARGRAVRSTYQQLDETYLRLLRQAGLVPEETA